MLYPPINKTVSHSPQATLQRIAKPERLLKIQQTVALENRAYTNLCELSKTICEQQFDQTEQNFVFKKDKYSFSPWKWKNQYNSQKGQLGKARKILILEHEKENKVKKQQNEQSENKENIFIKKQSLKKSVELKKYPSIYLRLLKVKEMKSVFKIKKCDPQIELITCMTKKKRQNKEKGFEHFNQSKLTRHQTAKQLLKCSPIKMEINSENRKRQLTRFTLHQSSSGSMLQPANKQVFLTQKKQVQLQKQHWKVKIHPNKSRKQRLLPKSELQNRNTRSKDSKENISLSKKGSVSFSRQKKQDYHINHPLTRVLYEKYLNTISVSHPNKGSKLKF